LRPRLSKPPSDEEAFRRGEITPELLQDFVEITGSAHVHRRGLGAQKRHVGIRDSTSM
jgi:hypothetical protein